MPFFLQNHPFAVEAYFDYSLVLTYAIPKQNLQPLIPPCLTLDTFNDRWAFVAVAMVQTKALRPKGLPRFLGNDFFLIGYRIFVRYVTNAGKRLRGLYILESETNRRNMAVLGSLFTRYQYTLTDIATTRRGPQLTITSRRSAFTFAVDTDRQPASLPPESPFNNWNEARRFAGPLPFTFSYAPQTREVLIVEGVREHWQPTPVAVMQADTPFFAKKKLEPVHLASAFIIRDIPYHWKKGRTERWNG